ncbi:hypothetical protein ECTOBSL9_0469 [Ectothiorhodospira sp. BSL-9]|nr:hypothetical protein ECTOBSL9_0469 [Ectothiorhodospira sp. BSL-9]
MLVIAIIFVKRHWSYFGRSLLFWCVVFYCSYVLVRGGYAAWIESPSIAESHWYGVKQWIKSGPFIIMLFGVLLVATGDWIRHGLGVLIAWILGFLVFLSLNTSLEPLLNAMQGNSRFFFEIGYGSLTLISPVFALGVLVLVVWSTFWALRQRSRHQVFALLAVIASVFLLAVATVVLVAPKSRGSWVSFVIGCIVVLVFMCWVYRKELPLWWKESVLGLLFMVIFAGAAFYTSWGVVEARWSQESDTVAALAQGKHLEEMDRSSFTIRFAYMVYGFEQVKSRWLIGYGPAGMGAIGDYHGGWHNIDPDVPPQMTGRISNLHNSHLGALFRFGIIGYLPIMIVIGLATLEASRNLRLGSAQRVLGIFVLGFVAILMFWGMTEEFFEKFGVEQLYAPILGVIIASFLSRRLTSHSTVH